MVTTSSVLINIIIKHITVNFHSIINIIIIIIFSHSNTELSLHLSPLGQIWSKTNKEQTKPNNNYEECRIPQVNTICFNIFLPNIINE